MKLKLAVLITYALGLAIPVAIGEAYSRARVSRNRQTADLLPR
jgi:hypothetical protein